MSGEISENGALVNNKEGENPPAIEKSDEPLIDISDDKELPKPDAFKLPKSIDKPKLGIDKNQSTKSIKVLTTEDVPLKYDVPAWACLPPDQDTYTLQVLKQGQMMEDIDLDVRSEQTYFVIGRLEGVDLKLEHPSISRYHAILQYGTNTMERTVKDGRNHGWHLYDLESTHGTVRNKQKVPGRQYVRLHVGHVLKFGGSTRLFILQGPSSDEEPESMLSVTEIKQRAARRKMIAEGIIEADPEIDGNLAGGRRAKKRKDGENSDEDGESSKANDGQDIAERGASWGMHDEYESGEGEPGLTLGLGMGTDGDIETGDEYYREDPKKALKHFFDREGLEMKFEYNEKGTNVKHQWNCRIELPLGNGRSVFTESSVSGHKKDAMVQCALEACKTLDAHGLLRRAAGGHGDQTAKRLARMAENDYYSSDEDDFYDRTGDLSKKRTLRKRRVEEIALGGGGQIGLKKSGKGQTYASLCKEIEEIQAEMADNQSQLDKLSKATSNLSHSAKESSKMDPLDSFMSDVKKTVNQQIVAVDTQETKLQKSVLRQRIVQLRRECERIERLAKVAKPVELPKLKPNTSSDQPIDKSISDKSAPSSATIDSKPNVVVPKKQQIWVGSMKGGKSQLLRTQVTVASSSTVTQTVSDTVVTEAAATVSDAGQEKPDEPMHTKVAKPETSSAKVSENVVVETKSEKQPKSTEPLIVSRAEFIRDRANQEKSIENVNNKVELNESEPDRRSMPKEDAAPSVSKRSRTRNRPNRKQEESEKKEGLEAQDYERLNDPDFAMWLPPDTQSGDGKTDLNTKLGY